MSLRMPLIVGIGGTTRDGSSSEQALSIALSLARDLGAKTESFTGQHLQLPIYDPDNVTLSESAQHLIDSLRKADGVIFSSPCYHGGLSGMLKNAIDYIEEMRVDPRVYLEGRAVGIIGCGYGYQGPGMVLAQLRQVVHALRGWPVPLGVALNSAVVKFKDGECSEPGVTTQIRTMAAQVVDFSKVRLAHE
jgi:FMN reductase